MRPLPRSIPPAVLASALVLGALGCGSGGSGQAGAEADTSRQVLPMPASGSDVAASTPGFQFRDAEGKEPLSLVVRPDRRVDVLFLDSAATALPDTAARRQARGVAERLWKEIGQAQRTDTVTVAFTNRAKITSDRVTRSYFFYASQLAAAK